MCVIRVITVIQVGSFEKTRLTHPIATWLIIFSTLQDIPQELYTRLYTDESMKSIYSKLKMNIENAEVNSLLRQLSAKNGEKC